MAETIPFPVLKINFQLLGINEKHFVKEVFWAEPYKWEKYFHFLFGKFQFQFWTPWLIWWRCCKTSFFDQRPGNGINNSISCLNNSISCWKSILVSLVKWRKSFGRSFFYRRPGSERDNSISYFNYSIPCFENQF